MTGAPLPRTRSGWARRLIEALDAEARAAVAADPASGLEDHFGLEVRPAASFARRGAGGWCDGVSLREEGVVLYRPTPHRRENFTLAHELGHHVVDRDDDCLSWLADLDDPDHEIEQLCDAIAGRLLVPDEVVHTVFEGGPPSAGGLVELFERTRASRTACLTAVVDRLPCDGFMVLVENGTPEIFYATRARNTRPYAWKGDPIPGGHPLASAKPPDRCETYWPYPTSAVHDRRTYFMSVAESDGWVFAVFAENNLWGVPGLHLSEDVEDDRGYSGTVTCPCGYSGTTRMWPCPDCGVSKCPRCRECECDRRSRQLKKEPCRGCTTTVAAHLLEDGLCDACR